MKSLQEKFKQHEKIIGTVASILAVVMFFALIEILISNIRGESNIYVQPIATAFNGLFWTMYAYGRKDYFLLVLRFNNLAQRYTIVAYERNNNIHKTVC